MTMIIRRCQGVQPEIDCTVTESEYLALHIVLCVLLFALVLFVYTVPLPFCGE